MRFHLEEQIFVKFTTSARLVLGAIIDVRSFRIEPFHRVVIVVLFLMTRLSSCIKYFDIDQLLILLV